MADPQPHLSVVDGGVEPNEALPDPRGRTRLVAIGLAAALAICAVGWLLSAQHGRELSASLAASNQALAEARGQVAAYEAHVSIARGRAGVLVDELEGLGDRLSELEAWLATAPGQPEPASTAADTRSEP